MIEKEVKETILEARAMAALGGHELGPFVELPEPVCGHEALCRLCDRSVWVGGKDLVFNDLDDVCPGEIPDWYEGTRMSELADPEDMKRLARKIKAFDEANGTNLLELSGLDYYLEEQE